MFVDSIRFHTSLSRDSPRYGGQGGAPFRMEGPPGGVCGMLVTRSPRGWLRRITGLLPLDQVQIDGLDNRRKGFLKTHRERVASKAQWICIFVLFCGLALLYPKLHMLWDFATGPTSAPRDGLDQKPLPHYVSIPYKQFYEMSSAKFSENGNTYR